MKQVAFKKSALVSIGTELEYQIINPHSYALMSRAKDLIRNIKLSEFSTRIKPEITQSMIELNTSIHTTPSDLMKELYELQIFLQGQAKQLGIAFAGGGTHPFQKWAMQKIFPIDRYRNLSRKYGYLSKRATVFGQHIHIGCQSGEDALYLTHALARYVPHFVAICASSPFYQGVDTGYFSSRLSIFNSFPLSGFMPLFTNWQEFSDYFYQMRSFGIVKTMKDFYWDIRPKPEFGTVEIRVCDTPLTFRKAVIMTAYIQALSHYLLQERPLTITKELYYVYSTNRFEASRYGYEGDIIDFANSKHRTIGDDILATIKRIERSANQLNTMAFLSPLIEDVMQKRNDAQFLRQLYKQNGSFEKVVEAQCEHWVSTK